MPRGFHVSAHIHDDDRLIIFRMTGEIDSHALVEKWIAAYSELAEPWRYNRLFDYRRASGIVDYDQIARFAAWWDQRTHGVDYLGKVAIIVNNPLDLARVSTVSPYFPRDIRRAFMTLDEGLNWLAESGGIKA
jgi:hypothetical protein